MEGTSHQQVFTGSSRQPPETQRPILTNRPDVLMIQYPTVHPTMASTDASYSVRMPHPAESSQELRPQGFTSTQRQIVASPRSNAHLSHISLLSNQDSVRSRNPHVQNDTEADPAYDEDGVHGTTSHNDQGMQKSYGDLDHNEVQRPIVDKARRNDPDRIRKMLQRSSGNLSSAIQAPTMEALTTAIRNGLKPSEPIQRPEPVRTRTDPIVRLPFQEDPDSPSSAYTDTTTSQTRPQSMPLSTYQGYDPRDSRPSTIHEHEFEDYERSEFDAELPTPNSINPIFANEHPGMSSRVPASKRPPKLDITAVREMESRGSVTSLPDLIRRATRLASNLDKGKTASRLGLLDFFGSSDKLGHNDRRNSSFSDVLDSFPTVGSPNRNRPTTMWPDDQKPEMSKAEPDLQRGPGKKRQRRCCGMSPIWFSVVLVALSLLVAAAVLIPIFLIVLPRQHAQTDTSRCSTSHSCSNGGFSVVSNNVCSCICVDGFTGSDCSKAKGPDCTIYSVKSDTKTFDNATVGTSVLSVLGSSQTTLNISLNQTILLTIFANTNLSCTSENSLVEFGSGTAVKSKRYVLTPGMMNTDQHVPALNLPAAESSEHKRFVIVDEIEDEPDNLPLLPTRVRNPRDNTMSTNGIVFATSGNTATPQSTVPSSSYSAIVATATASPSNATISGVSDQQIEFAGTVVLYVLQTFEQINVAVAANQAIASYFKATDHKNNTVQVVSGNERIDANFDTLQIVLANGTVLGGS